MNILKILLALLLILTIFILDKLAIYSKIPGFHKVQSIYLSQQDIYGKDKIYELTKSLSSLSESLELEKNMLEEEIKSSCQVNLTLDRKFKVVPAKVIQIPPGIFPEEFVVNVGYSDGVKKYSLVLKDGVLFGRVIDVGSRTSRVLTIFSSAFFADAYLLKSKGRAILRGSRSGILSIFTSMWKNPPVQGDIFVTAGTEFNEPFGLKIAFFDEEGKIIPFADYSDTLYVSIIIPVGKEDDKAGKEDDEEDKTKTEKNENEKNEENEM